MRPHRLCDPNLRRRSPFFLLSTLCSLTLSQVPCITSAASAAGCSGGDYRCRCSSSSVIQASAQNCVISNCGIATALQVQAGASSVCACVATAPAGVAARATGVWMG